MSTCHHRGTVWLLCRIVCADALQAGHGWKTKAGIARTAKPQIQNDQKHAPSPLADFCGCGVRFVAYRHSTVLGGTGTSSKEARAAAWHHTTAAHAGQKDSDGSHTKACCLPSELKGPSLKERRSGDSRLPRDFMEMPRCCSV